ncbi:MAG: alpha/beta hydrolase, partial [Planctomycetota bacterium]
GWVLVSLNYRLLPGGSHPVNVRDVAVALAWVHAHIAQYGGDPDRLLLMGHSAGAHLAALVASDARHLQAAGSHPGILRGVIELDTNALDIPRLMPSRLYQSVFGTDPAIWRDASPIAHVGPDTPPFLCIHADDKRSKREQAEAFVAAVQSHGVLASAYAAPDRTHGTLNIRIGTADDHVTRRIEDFIGTVLGQSARVWVPDLLFDARQRDGRPLPVNAMNLATFAGELFCGTAAAFEAGGYSQHSAHVFRKTSAGGDWSLDLDLGPGSERVACLEPVVLERGSDGRALREPVHRLLAGTMAGRRQAPAVPTVQLRDAVGWQRLELPLAAQDGFQIRAACVHRDARTGADLLMLAVSPAPAGIIRGVADPEAPGGIRFTGEPELVDTMAVGNGKWYGIVSAGGHCFASTRSGIWRRIDGPDPTWIRVYEADTQLRELRNGEIRGLTAVPDPAGPGQALLFTHRMHLWRLGIPEDPAAEHPVVQESDLRAVIGATVGGSVVFAEAAFNPIPAWYGPDGERLWPIGVQYVLEDPDADRAAPLRDRVILPRHAAYLLRGADGSATLHTIEPAAEETLFLARDFEPSPFAGEAGSLYACGFNGSYFKGSLGTAWVFRLGP